MEISAKMRNKWERRVPGLSGKYTHWSLLGDEGDIILTSDLKELIKNVSLHYGRSLKITVCRAYVDQNGNCIADNTTRVVICDFINDKISRRQKHSS